jgi:hypothetical protein
VLADDLEYILQGILESRRYTSRDTPENRTTTARTIVANISRKGKHLHMVCAAMNNLSKLLSVALLLIGERKIF